MRWVASTGSTNADVTTLARAGSKPGLVIVSEHQATGRGRLGRNWESPAGASVALSALATPAAPGERWTWLPLLTGLAVAAALRTLDVADVTVKWPNDVLAGGKKICGILAELVPGPTGPAVVIGLGVNISLDASELPVPTATSLLLLGCETDKTEVTAKILRLLDAWLGRLESGADLGSHYVRDCATIGRDVRVEGLGADPILGTAFGVDDAGRLGVRTAAGPRWFAAGDVHHLR